MTKSLNGAHVLVTRPAHQAEGLCQLIAQHGGVPIRYPTLAIVGANQHNLATISPEQLSKLQWLIFTSANAVNFALPGNSGKIREFIKAKVAAIGSATAQALLEKGLDVDLLPSNGSNSEALLAMPALQQVNTQHILIVRGQGGRDTLAHELTARGADVGYLEVYKRVIPEHDNAEIDGLLAKNVLAASIITSAEALENLLKMLNLKYQKAVKTIPLVVISDRIKKLAVSLGFKQITVSANPADAAIVDAVITAINEEQCG